MPCGLAHGYATDGHSRIGVVYMNEARLNAFSENAAARKRRVVAYSGVSEYISPR